LRAGRLPVNAGYLGPDPDCRLGLVLDRPARTTSAYALSLTTAFGGANTALLVGTP
jgi:3-oxoacyl-[acyl-carrier-protein] synthase II